jgi:hypothetical protein
MATYWVVSKHALLKPPALPNGIIMNPPVVSTDRFIWGTALNERRTVRICWVQ